MADGSMYLVCDAELVASGRLPERQLAEALDGAARRLAATRDPPEDGQVGLYCATLLPPFPGADLPCGIHPEDRRLQWIKDLDELAIIVVGDFYDSLLGWGVEHLDAPLRGYLETFALTVSRASSPTLVGYWQVWDGADHDSNPRIGSDTFASVDQWLAAPVVPYRIRLVRV